MYLWRNHGDCIEPGGWRGNIRPFSIGNTKGCIRKLEMTSLTFSINKRWTPRTPLALRVHIISHKFDVILCCRSASEKRILKRKQNNSKKLSLLKFMGSVFVTGTVTCPLERSCKIFCPYSAHWGLAALRTQEGDIKLGYSIVCKWQMSPNSI